MIRVLLVEDHATLRQSLAFVLEREPDFAVVAEAGSLAEARGVLEGVDVVILDHELPDGSGEDLIGEFYAANPSGAVLVLTGSPSRAVHARAVEAGAAGVLHKSVRIEDVVEAARRLHKGEALLSPGNVIELLRLAGRQREEGYEAREAIQRLTPREREVLQALADGLGDKEIAERLHVGTGTIRNHVASILGKFGVQSRLQALVFAVRHGVARIE